MTEHGDLRYGVTHYDLTLQYRAATNWLGGLARIDVVTAQPADLLELDLYALRVSQLRIDGSMAHYTHRDGRLRVTLPRPVGAGTVMRLEVRYAGTPRPVPSAWGGVGWEELTDGALVASQPVGAPSWFPCNDRPSDKATYRISVTTASPYQAIANGAPAERRRAAGTTTWVYDQVEPMATYLASVQVGRYQVAGGLAFPPRLAGRVRYDFARQPRMMELFSNLFGPYPFAAGYTVVVADDELEIPVEAQGMSIFGRNHVDGRRTFERLVAHELAHQWFGNSLTVGSWSDIWLHEGFATYAEWLWSEFSGGPPAAELATRWYGRLRELPEDFALADPAPDLLFDDRVYKRGALTVHLLRTRMGDEAFFAMVRDWTAEHRHGTVSTAAFLTHTPRSLAPALSQWLYDKHLPPWSP